MKSKMTRWQKVGFFVAGLVPALWLGLGLFMLLGGAVLTVTYVLVHLLLPVLTLVWLYRVIRRNADTTDRIVFSVLILVGAVILAVVIMFRGHFSIHDHAEGENALQMYESDIGQYDLMPEEADLGQPEKIEYHYFYNQWAIFESDCYTLICAYTPEDYSAMCEELDSRFTFHSEFLNAGEGRRLPPLYTLDGYEFRFLDMDSDIYRLMYPKSMVLIGTNNETHEIVWSYYDDDDLDWIPDPQEFLLEDCGWKYIR